MLYTLLKIPAKIAFRFYCRKIYINKPDALLAKGPLLIAANHPNSFLDAIILSTISRYPIHSLTRGDVFANRFFRALLGSLKMLPVYRISEGAEKLGNNYTTFDACIEIFRKNGIVLIFSEGRCINEWRLRSLKKGTARLSISAWQQNIPLKVLPLGINYSSFGIYGKNVTLNFGDIITRADFPMDLNSGRGTNDFNALLNEQLKKLVVEMDSSNKQQIKEQFYVQPGLLKKVLLFIPAIAGWLVHLPLYLPIKLLLKKKAEDHYDSVAVGLLFVLYPFYLLFIAIALVSITKSGLAWFSLLLLPFTAWSCLQLKRQIE